MQAREFEPSPSAAPDPRGGFPSTRWTIVGYSGNADQCPKPVAWDEFCRSYRRPLQLWLYHRTNDHHLAEELVQSFLAKLHLNERALDSLNPSKGRLRSWLLTCLRRHWIDEWRARGPETEEILSDIADTASPSDDSFDREWAFSLARRVLSGLRDEYQARGKSRLFEAMLRSLESPDEAKRSDICRELGISENLFAVAFMRFRERLAVRLREEVAATVADGDPAEVDAELRYLILILSRQGGLAAACSGSSDF